MTTTADGLADRQVAAILKAILVIVRQTKPIFELEPEFDGSNPYMFRRNRVINDIGRVSTKAN